MGFYGTSNCPICGGELKDMWSSKYCPKECDRLGLLMGTTLWRSIEWRVYRVENSGVLSDNDRIYWWHKDYGPEKPAIITDWACTGEDGGPGVRWGEGRVTIEEAGYDLDEFYYVRFLKS